MSNFQCPHCGMTNIDCGKAGFKTPREIELEKRVKELEEEIKEVKDLNIRLDNQRETYYKEFLRKDKALEEIEEVWAKDKDGDYDFVKWQILDIINKAKGEEKCQ